jgi:hypothetical protein
MKAVLKAKKSCKKPSDIDPSGKDSNPANTETSSSKEAGPTTEDHPTGAQASTDNVNPSDQPPTRNQSAEAETAASQEPPTGNQSESGPDQEIPEVETQADASQGPDAGNDPTPRSSNKGQGSPRTHPEIALGNPSSQVTPIRVTPIYLTNVQEYNRTTSR